MSGDPRDPKAYQFAIVFLGLALVVALVGAAWVSAVPTCEKGHCGSDVLGDVWLAAGALGGAFVGALIPREDLGRACRPLALAALIAVALAAFDGSQGFYVAGVTFGGVLLGLPIPSPGSND